MVLLLEQLRQFISFFSEKKRITKQIQFLPKLNKK